MHDPNMVTVRLRSRLVPLHQVRVLAAVGVVVQGFGGFPVQQPNEGVTRRGL